MRSFSKAIAGALALASVTAPAQAQICEVNLAGRIGIDKAGGLQVDFVGAGIVRVCSMTTADGGVSREACEAWYSALLSFRLAKARARFYFVQGDAGNSALTACSGLGDWTSHTPYFLESY